MSLVHLLKRFLRLEIFAAEMYRVHMKHVPVTIQPIIHHFKKIEDHHVDVFQKLYQNITQETPPTFKGTQQFAYLFARFISYFGPKTILKAECWIERMAVKDYQQALNWINDENVKQAIHEVLQDEHMHDNIMQSLKTFKHDEEKHIHEMMKILKNDV